MKKDYILSTYYKASVLLAMGAFLSLFLYLEKFPESMFGDIIKSLFSLDFNIGYQVSDIVINSALIVFICIFLVNIGVLIYSLTGEKVKGLLAEAVFYNTIITLLIVISHIAYNIQIPINVNGEIIHSIFHSTFFVLSDVKVIAFNLSYLLITIYLFYNVYVIYKLIPKKIKNEEIEKEIE